jgi:hypothetical protein
LKQRKEQRGGFSDLPGSDMGLSPDEQEHCPILSDPDVRRLQVLNVGVGDGCAESSRTFALGEEFRPTASARERLREARRGTQNAQIRVAQQDCEIPRADAFG